MTCNGFLHLALAERQIIETGVSHDITKATIVKTLGKDQSTISKDIKSYRLKSFSTSYPITALYSQNAKIKNA